MTRDMIQKGKKCIFHFISILKKAKGCSDISTLVNVVLNIKCCAIYFSQKQETKLTVF